MGSGSVSKLKAAVTIDYSRCNKCGLCVKLCPTTTFTYSDNHIVAKSNECIGCKACEALCLQKAIKITISSEGLEIRRYVTIK